MRATQVKICLAILLVYGPFLGTRLMSMTGDERVYVAQAVEMAERGLWFKQVLMSLPDYYKGPLHLVLIQLGYCLLGLTPWALLWMNLVAVMAGACALGAVVRKNLPAWKDGDLWIGVAFATAIGIHTHTLASQMEAELAGLMAVSLFLLDRLKRSDAGWAFWIVAGVAGWLKSPLHSVLIGVTGITYLAMNGELLPRLKRAESWAAWAAGIATCVLGYLPILLTDWKTFHGTYLLRESLQKAANGVPWYLPWLSLFFYGLYPWVWLALLSYAQTFAQARAIWRDEPTRRILSLAIAGALPSAIFFSIFPYRLENYTYPAIGAVLLAVAANWAWRGWTSAWRWTLRGSAVPMLAVTLAVGSFQLAMHPSGDWWPAWIGPLTLALAAAIALLAIRPTPARISASAAAAAVALNLFFWGAGQREILDLRRLITEVDALPAQARPRISCLNSSRNIWSDCTLLSFWVGRRIEVVHNKRDYREALLRGDYLLLKTREFDLESFKRLGQLAVPGIVWETRPWKRWLTQGRAPDGTPAWRAALAGRDLSLIESENYIVRALPPKSPPAPAVSFDSPVDAPAEHL